MAWTLLASWRALQHNGVPAVPAAWPPRHQILNHHTLNQMLRSAPPPISGARGATLVEVLVALLILSVGLLGIAALYVDNLRNGRTGILRTQAATLAADMADRIRTHRAGAAAFTWLTSQRCIEPAPNASAETVVATEVACWQDDVAKELPNGTGTIGLDTTTLPATYTVTVSWSETGAGTASYVVRVQA